jgi:Na+-transporting NADH:ubiquinone oxidoreductase subunit C
MKNFSNKYIFIYITVLVGIVAVLLALAAVALQPRQEENRLMESYAQILMSVGYTGEDVTGREVIKTYQQLTDTITTDSNLFVLKVKAKDGNFNYVIPVKGKGLWGPIWGYIAVAEDGNTITGAVFSHKGETPGLGAEIDKPQFANEFKDKQLFDENGEFVSVRVVKGGVANSNINPLHGVDAVTGGTVTSNGVDKMLKECLGQYAKFLKGLSVENPNRV